MAPFLYKRIVVIGATGCGKSTLAEQLAQKLGVDYVELDALHWEPNWVKAPLQVFRQRTEKATRSAGWALAGNYHVVRDIIWPRAEAVVWLDYPFLLVFGRLLRRIWQRWRSHELLWGTNYEPFWVHLKLWSDDSLIKWLFKTYWRRRREYPLLLARPEYAHLKVFHFRHPRELKAWLEAL